jgi:aspartyl-tRNA(Asn)/glutamyl-tRNA(Gln) amidotransferase subunit B
MAQTGKSPEDIVSEKRLVQVTDRSAIEAAVTRVLSRHPTEVADYRSGKTKLLGFFVGQVMKETRGKANPKLVNEIIRDKLDR